MDVMECIAGRRSVRSYEDREVEDEKLRQVLEAARLAPSARNQQMWKFIAVRDVALRRKLVDAAMGQTFLAEAPVVLAACATQTGHVMTCGHPAHLIDVAIAVDHMTLAARALGLGTCWIGAFEQHKARAVLGVPDRASVVALTPLGYPTFWPDAPSRKGLAEVTCVDRWQD